MFDILFGWRKASKCRKLITRVQCRLKLLKNKRCCIVKQLRQDVAQLLKHGHHQTALERVEQLFKEENMVQVYDLLDNFCEFIVINLPHIRKHKGCPDDINEAISALIFSSARFGNLPELVPLRKLFGERYGQIFIKSALELSPENLVNHQIQEKLHIKNVPDDVKYRLLNEIASSLVEPGPLLLEYKPYFHEEEATNISNTQILNRDIQRNNLNEALQVQIFDKTEVEGKIVHMDLASESVKSSKDHHNRPTKDQIFPIVEQNSAPGEVAKVVKPEVNKFQISRGSGATYGVGSVAEDSSSETSAQLPDEMIYLDDIEEFVSPVSKNGDFQDQRLFMFKSFVIPLKEKNKYNHEERQLSSNEKSVSKCPRKIRKSSRKRLRRRLVSQESRNVTDVECAIYYGESDEKLFDNKHESHYQKHQGNNSLMEKRRNSFVSGKGQNRIVKDRRSSFSLIEGRNGDIVKDSTVHILETGKIQHGLELFRYSCRDEAESHVPNYSRALTMPSERANESYLDNIYRSNSFPLEQHCSYRHIHPKLPDYDELAAKFMALKRENTLNKQQGSDQ